MSPDRHVRTQDELGARMTAFTPATVFDQLRQDAADGSEFWSARDLMPALGYQRWENAQAAITRAIEACENSGNPTDTHFRATTKKARLGGSAERDILDYRLSRYGAYLTAMNSDPGKAQVALAQTYFAVQARRAELNTVIPDDPILAALALLTEVRRAQLATEAELSQQRQALTALQAAQAAAPIHGREVRVIHDLGRELGQVMGNYRRAWRLFNDRFGLASYRDLSRTDFEAAQAFLRAQIGLHRSPPLMP